MSMFLRISRKYFDKNIILWFYCAMLIRYTATSNEFNTPIHHAMYKTTIPAMQTIVFVVVMPSSSYFSSSSSSSSSSSIMFLDGHSHRYWNILIIVQVCHFVNQNIDIRNVILQVAKLILSHKQGWCRLIEVWQILSHCNGHEVNNMTPCHSSEMRQTSVILDDCFVLVINNDLNKVM